MKLDTINILAPIFLGVSIYFILSGKVSWETVLLIALATATITIKIK